METIAVYWESRIKTYGIRIRKDLVFIRLQIPSNQMAAWGSRLQRESRKNSGFVLATGAMANSEIMEAGLLFDPSESMPDRGHALQKIGNGFSAGPAEQRPVDLLYFQGPHFSDRYGIAHAAFELLGCLGVPVVAGTCSGSCVHIIVDAGYADRAADALSKKFYVPGADPEPHPPGADRTETC